MGLCEDENVVEVLQVSLTVKESPPQFHVESVSWSPKLRLPEPLTSVVLMSSQPEPPREECVAGATPRREEGRHLELSLIVKPGRPQFHTTNKELRETA